MVGMELLKGSCCLFIYMPDLKKFSPWKSIPLLHVYAFKSYTLRNTSASDMGETAMGHYTLISNHLALCTMCRCFKGGMTNIPSTIEHGDPHSKDTAYCGTRKHSFRIYRIGLLSNKEFFSWFTFSQDIIQISRGINIHFENIHTQRIYIKSTPL